MEYRPRLENGWTSLAGAWKAPPKRTISQWAEEFGVITDGAAEPGRWKTIGYQRAILDSFTRPEVEEITFIKSARLGWTEIVKHTIGYYIDQDPCSILAVQPAIEDAEGWSKEQLAPFFDECEPMRDKVAPPKARDSKSTILKKYYPGGILHLIGANSPRGFRRIATRVVLFDEIDGYPHTTAEGDQLKLGAQRAQTFWNRKIAYGSTPTEAGTSRIEDKAALSSMGHCLLTCPHCGGEHVRKFREPDKPIQVSGTPLPVSIIQWSDNYRSAAWICPDCASVIENRHNRKMIAGCRWVGDAWEWTQDGGFTFYDNFDGHIGFNLWAGYALGPNSTPVKIAKEFLQVKDRPDQLRTFTNTVLGEPWKEPGDEIEPTLLQRRAETYAADVPLGGRVLTAGVDLQSDRIEMGVDAWDEGEQSWDVDYQVFYGDITQSEVWDQLDAALRARYQHESGRELPIAGFCIDSSYMPSLVHEFVRRFGYKHGYAVIGRPGEHRPIVEDRIKRAARLRKRQRRGNEPEIVGVDEAKAVFYRRLKLTKPGPGYCHFSTERDAEYFEQITAEKLRTSRYVKGRAVREWIKIRPRNEALDNRNYSQAALRLLNVDWKKITKTFEGAADPTPADKPKPKPKTNTPRRTTQKSLAKRKRKNWATDI